MNPEKKAIVIASDLAKYELESSGEYTQGAGSVAMLITSNPRIIAFKNTIGIKYIPFIVIDFVVQPKVAEFAD